MKEVLLIIVIALHSGICNAQAFTERSCLDRNTGIRYGNGDSWEPYTCMHCECTVSKQLLKICKNPRLGKVVKEIVVREKYAKKVKTNVMKRCSVITEEKAKILPEEHVVRFYSQSEYKFCYSKLFTPTDVHEDCEANYIEDECRYEVLNKETGGECEHPVSIVGK